MSGRHAATARISSHDMVTVTWHMAYLVKDTARPKYPLCPKFCHSCHGNTLLQLALGRDDSEVQRLCFYFLEINEGQGPRAAHLRSCPWQDSHGGCLGPDKGRVPLSLKNKLGVGATFDFWETGNLRVRDKARFQND